MSKIREQWEKEHGYDVFKPKDPFSFKNEYVEELEQRLEAGQHETIVMPPLSIKAKRTMPVEMVVRKEYEQIKTFYKDVFHLLGSMNYDPNAKNVNELLNRAKAFVDKHEY